MPPSDLNLASWYDYRPVVVGKVSPSGDLMWHKVIWGPQHHCAFALQQTGDSSFMVMVGIKMSHNMNNRLFYLDTLLTSADAGYLLLGDSTVSTMTNGFITFDLEGNVLEQHFLEVGYLDSVGRPITMERVSTNNRTPQALMSSVLSAETFSVDHQGNIYVVRKTNDRVFRVCEPGEWSSAQARDLSIADGNISGLKIMVDGTRALYCPVTQRSALWNQQILKFSPHFDSLLASTYLFDSTYTEIQIGTRSPTTKTYSMVHDSYDNLYVSYTGTQLPTDVLNIMNSDSLQLKSLTETAGSTWIVRYTQHLHATDLVQTSIFEDSQPESKMLNLIGSYIDEETNSIFLRGTFYWGSSDSTIAFLLHNSDTHTIISENRAGYWLRLDKDNLNVLSQGIVHSTARAESISSLTTFNNRIYTQAGFRNNIQFGDTVINTSQPTDHDLVFAIWDYDGHELLIEDYQLQSPENIGNQIHIMDSAVYLAGVIYDNATFGSHVVPNYGNSTVYIAKYLDGKHAGEWTATGTQFQVPYVFKTLFSKEKIEFADMCETKSVSTALYLDMNEELSDLSDKDEEQENHNYIFVGKVGSFCPIKPGCKGGLLMREKDGKYSAATGSKGYRWLESEMVKTLEKQDDIDISYYRKLVDDAKDTISKYGDFEAFVT